MTASRDHFTYPPSSWSLGHSHPEHAHRASNLNHRGYASNEALYWDGFLAISSLEPCLPQPFHLGRVGDKTLRYAIYQTLYPEALLLSRQFSCRCLSYDGFNMTQSALTPSRSPTTLHQRHNHQQYIKT
ncbi:hypothetical protein A0H81_09459 [Grifola frondosa]|uniref:Uncharacterized protein n=1 Tax=Grifola frondosa TaxID=5627 RepID=A0A1C7M1N4_GRIFR|nr:hypothetical protein A0H81_09459 [Grifola frondosa]